MTGQWFSPGTRVSSTNKTDHHDITEILLKMALNTITLTLTSSTIIKLTWRLTLFIHIYFVIMCLLHAIYLICWIKCVHLAQDVWYMSTQTIFVEYFKIRHVCTFHVQMRYETVNLVFLFCFVPVSKARTHTLYIPIPPSPPFLVGFVLPNHQFSGPLNSSVYFVLKFTTSDYPFGKSFHFPHISH